MADTNLTLVQETHGAFGRGDIPAVLGAFTADIEWNVPAVLPHGAKARGPEEVGRFFEVLASTWENFDLQLDDFVASGDRVCAFGSAHGTLRGKHTGYGFVHAWTVRDGALARLDEYVDPEPELYAG